MSIRLNLLDYRITNDSHQLILSKVRKTESGELSVDKNGNENLNTLGYYSFERPDRLLLALENDYIFNGEEELTSLKAVRERCVEVVELLEDINERLIANVRGD
jgi:hypothetical protein